MGQCEYGSLATKSQQRGAATWKLNGHVQLRLRATRHLEYKGPLLGLLVVKHRTDNVGPGHKV